MGRRRRSSQAGTVVVFPFDMDTIVTPANDRFIATHYGPYNTICGIGIAVGNLATGTTLDLSRAFGVPWAPWAVLVLIGMVSAFGVHTLSRSDRLVALPTIVS